MDRIRSKLHDYWPSLIAIALLPFGLENALVIILVATLSIYLSKYSGVNLDIRMILLLGFLARALIAVIDHHVILFPYPWDDYYSTAMIIKKNIVLGYPWLHNINTTIHIVSYSLASSFVYFLFGDHQILMRIINSFLAVLAGARIFKISNLLFKNQRAAYYSLIIFIFYPSIIVYTVIDMRDSLILFITVDGLYRIVGLFFRSSAKNKNLLVFEIFLLFFLRTQYIVLFSFILLLYIIIRLFTVGKYRLLAWSLSLLIVLAAIYLLINAVYFQNLLGYINRDMKGRTLGGSFYLEGIEYRTWVDVVRWTPLRMLHFLFGPFPWRITNSFMLLGFLESSFLLLLVLGSIKSFQLVTDLQSKKAIVVLVLFAVVGLAGNALIDSNYGTAIRHKINYIYVFIILASSYFEKIRIKLL
jgi:hypothetical protein